MSSQFNNNSVQKKNKIYFVLLKITKKYKTGDFYTSSCLLHSFASIFIIWKMNGNKFYQNIVSEKNIVRIKCDNQ